MTKPQLKLVNAYCVLSQTCFSHAWIQCSHGISRDLSVSIPWLLFPVLTSFSSRFLSYLGKLLSSPSRFLTWLCDPNGRRGSLPGRCKKLPRGRHSTICLGHTPIAEQTAAARENPGMGWAWVTYPPLDPWTKWRCNGLTKDIWVLLLEKERLEAAKPTAVLTWRQTLPLAWPAQEPLVRNLLEHYITGPLPLLHKSHSIFKDMSHVPTSSCLQGNNLGSLTFLAWQFFF